MAKWEGLTQAEIDAGWPDKATYAEQNPVEWHFSSPGGEGLHDLQARADSFLQDLSGPTVVFTHGILSRVLRARWLGLNEYEMLDLPGGQGIIFHLSSDAWTPGDRKIICKICNGRLTPPDAQPRTPGLAERLAVSGCSSVG